MLLYYLCNLPSPYPLERPWQDRRLWSSPLGLLDFDHWAPGAPWEVWIRSTTGAQNPTLGSFSWTMTRNRHPEIFWNAHPAKDPLRNLQEQGKIKNNPGNRKEIFRRTCDDSDFLDFRLLLRNFLQNPGRRRGFGRVGALHRRVLVGRWGRPSERRRGRAGTVLRGRPEMRARGRGGPQWIKAVRGRRRGRGRPLFDAHIQGQVLTVVIVRRRTGIHSGQFWLIWL